MTTKQKIQHIDKAIISLRAYRNMSDSAVFGNYRNTVNSVKDCAKQALVKIGADERIINQIGIISFSRPHWLRDALTSQTGGLSICKSNDYYTEDYQNGIDAVIRILDDVRNSLERERNTETQNYSLIASIIAAFASVASIIVTIILYLCKN